MGRVKRKSAYEHAQNTQSDHTSHAQSIIRVFALNYYVLQYPMILLADSEGPDQTARMRRLIWAFATLIMPEKTFLHGAVPMNTVESRYLEIQGTL